MATCIVEVVEEAARRFPSAIAFVEHSTGRTFTYSQLLLLAEKLANVLKQIIVYPQEIVTGIETPLVAILTERSLVSIVSILAILKARAAYVPVDPSFPDDRQEHIISHSQCQLALVDRANIHRLAGVKGVVSKVILMNNHSGEVDESDEAHYLLNNKANSHTKLPRLTDASLAYVLYTSGSTGKPKGVMVKNKGLLNVVQFFVDLLKITAADRILCLTTLCFDISMLELFMPLVSGATLVMVTATTQKNPLKILDCIKDCAISVMQATPTTYEMLIACGWNGDMNIRFLVGGEACRPKVAALASHCKALYNVYGPTETSIWSSSFLLPSDPTAIAKMSTNIPVGTPLWKTQFYVVDEQGRDLTDEGGEGELWIGGDGVALGYLHAPELTVQRFLRNPFGPGEVYRTGDLFRKMEDGNFIFVRRMDDQVKVNGYRIELAEVEIAISDHPSVEQAVVIVKDNALWGFVKLLHTADEDLKNSTKILTKTLQAFARRKLPPYMIPKLIIAVEEFPKTANGKLDRLTLGKKDLTPYMLEEQGTAAVANHPNQTTADLTEDSVRITEAVAGNERVKSMVGYVKAFVMKQSGQSPSSNSSFAAVGIDSLAAMMFRNILSQSLGGVKIDPDVLYDPDTTIESFSIDLFERLERENPSLLQRLQITQASDPSDIEEGGGSHQEKKESVILGRLLLQKKNWVDGLRGALICLVMIDHFFWKNSIGGKRLECDTVLFVVITGMTSGLQDLAQLETVMQSQNTIPFTWNPWTFLHSRFVGLFPIYWVGLLFSIPILWIQYYSYDLNTADFTGMIILYVTGLQTWSLWSNTAMHYVYFVSFVWSILIMYALFKTALLARIHAGLKGFIVLCLIGFLIGMYVYNSDGGFHPPLGCGYFALGYVAAMVYAMMQRSFLDPAKLGFYKGYMSVQTNNNNNINSLYNSNNHSNHNHAMISDSETSETSNQSSSEGHVVELWKFIPSILLDIFTFFFFFVIFFNNFPGDNTTTNPTINHLPSDYEKRHTKEYWNYDTMMKLIGIPVILSLMLIAGFLQPKTHEYSLFSNLVSNTKIFVLIGECSLAIYVFNQLFVNFYWKWAVAGIQLGQFPYTTNFVNLHGEPEKDYDILKPFGILVVFLLAVFLHKVFQDRFVTHLHLKFMNYLSKSSSSKQGLGEGGTEVAGL